MSITQFCVFFLAYFILSVLEAVVKGRLLYQNGKKTPSYSRITGLRTLPKNFCIHLFLVRFLSRFFFNGFIAKCHK